MWRNHPLSTQDSINVNELKKLDFILREKGSGSRELFDSMMLLQNIEIDPIGDLNDITLSRELSIIYHKNKYLTKAANEFIKLCLS
jgi:molybdate-binding protein